VVVQGDELRPVRDAERLQQTLGRAGVLRGDDGRLSSAATSRAEASPRFPMGVAARMITAPA
jgi:hypothetical protein